MQISCHSTTHIICSQCVFQLLIVLVFSLLYALIFVPWKTEVCHWTWPAGGLDKTLEGGRKRNGFYSPCSFPSGLQFWHQLHPSSFGHSSCAMCPLPCVLRPRNGTGFSSQQGFRCFFPTVICPQLLHHLLSIPSNASLSTVPLLSFLQLNPLYVPPILGY